MNSHLIPAVPPRLVKVYSPAAAVTYFETLLTQLARVCGVTHVARCVCGGGGGGAWGYTAARRCVFFSFQILRQQHRRLLHRRLLHATPLTPSPSIAQHACSRAGPCRAAAACLTPPALSHHHTATRR
jgi:hypothetical protein